MRPFHSRIIATTHSLLNGTKPFFTRMALAGLMTPLAVGCSQQAAVQPNSLVAVVDLDKVAEKTGIAEQIKQKLSKKESTLNQELLSAQADLRQKFLNQKQAAGETPSQEDAQKLRQFEATANQALNNARNFAKNVLDQERVKLIAQYREQVKPVIAKLAEEKGYSVVIPKNDGLLLAISPGVEITDVVAAAVREKKIQLDVSASPTSVSAAKPTVPTNPAAEFPASPSAQTNDNLANAPEMPAME